MVSKSDYVYCPNGLNKCSELGLSKREVLSAHLPSEHSLQFIPTQVLYLHNLFWLEIEQIKTNEAEINFPAHILGTILCIYGPILFLFLLITRTLHGEGIILFFQMQMQVK